MEESKYTANSETDRVIGVFDTFSKDANEIRSSSVNHGESLDQLVLTMSSLGKLGRFGNQLFQYAFLRICAKKSGSRVECPPWIGQTLFGLNDPPIFQNLPPAIERGEVRESLFDVVPEFIPFIEKLASAKSCRVGAEALESGLVNVDLWGFFQVHTRSLAPHKEFFRSLFQPVSELKYSLEDGLNLLRSKGKTIIGIHVRRGDFLKLPLAGFTLVVPSKWWCNWLEEMWDELEEPVLFLCSDELDSIIHDFDKFSPVTSRDLCVKLPERMKDLNAEFYTDFFLLSNCDIVGSSNSIFSFAACMLNERGNLFFRPQWDFSTKFILFDPWNSEPLLYKESEKHKFKKKLFDTLYAIYVTQGFFGLLKSMFIYIPRNFIERFLLRLYLGYQVQGGFGIIKSLLYTFGWRSVWEIS